MNGQIDVQFRRVIVHLPGAGSPGGGPGVSGAAGA